MLKKNSAVQLNAVNHTISLDQFNYLQVTPNNTLLRTSEWYAGFNKLRQQSAPDAKLGHPKGTTFVEPEIQEVTKLANKEKWMQCFKKAYSGEIRRLPRKAYDPEISRMFIAKLGNKEIGFIRITNKTIYFKEIYDGEVWNIGEIYVKPAYRSQGISSILIHYVSRCCHVKSILLEPERYEENQYYFNRQGFTFSLETEDGLFRVYLGHFKNIVLRRLALASPHKILNVEQKI
jgi:GNAT superfamily N-acetyltransferase